MKYIAVLDTDDYEDFDFFEDGNGKYLHAVDAGSVNGEWIALYFTECEQEPCEDAISRAEVLKAMDTWDKFGYTETGCFVRAPKNAYVPYVHYDDMVNCVKGMPSVTPTYGTCKECKWWKDSDGLYRRGGHAESQCPINRREVFEGNGYCYMFEPPQESEDKE